VKYWGLVGFGVIAAASTASSAVAQVTADSMIAGTLARSMHADASMRAEYDSNIARTSPQAASLLGLREDDISYAPTLNLNIVDPIGRQAVFLQGSVGYQFHQYNRQLDSEQINLSGGAGASVGRCGSVLSGGFFRGRSQQEQLGVVVNVENILEVKRASLGITCATPAGLGLVFSTSYDQGDNSLPQVAMSDFRSTSVSGGIMYGRPSTGSVQLLASYTRTDTPNTVFPAIGSDGYENESVGVTFSRRAGGKIELNASVNYSKVNLLTPANPILVPGSPSSSSAGLTYTSSIDYRASSRLQFHGSFNRQITPTLLAGSPYEIQTLYAVRGDYRLGSRILIGAGADLGRDSGQANVAALAATTLTNSEVKGIFASVRYQQSPRIFVVLDARHESRTANLPQFEYTSDRVGLALGISY
jgi:hypothetical protein